MLSLIYLLNRFMTLTTTLQELRDIVDLLLQKANPAVANHPLFAQGDQATLDTKWDGMFYRAVNNAMRRAEQAHDFQFSLKCLQGVIPAGIGGLSLSGLTEYGGSDTFDVKTLETVYIKGDGDALTVVRHESRKRMTDRLLERDDNLQVDQTSEVLESKVLTFGGKVYMYPTNLTQDVNVVFDAYVWQPLFDDLEAVSPFLQYGFEYMQWATVVEANHLFQTFVPRQEGSLPPPIKERDDALRRLIDWDVYQYESGRNIVLD